MGQLNIAKCASVSFDVYIREFIVVLILFLLNCYAFDAVDSVRLNHASN